MTRLFPRCSWLGLVLVLAPQALRGDDWPRWQGPKGDSVWRETGLLEKFPVGGPKVLWRSPVGTGFSGPAVVGGRVYLMDRQGDQPPKGREGFGKDGLKGKERVLCLDAASGKEVWKHEYDSLYKIAYPSGPRCTPAVLDGKVYTLGAMGDLRCLDAANGKVHWAKNLPDEYKTKPPLWGYSAPPLVDGDKVFCLVGGEGSAAVAFDRHTGKELWRALTIEEIGYAPPVLAEAGGKRQLVLCLTESVQALDPETGKVYWSVPYPDDKKKLVRPEITISTPRQAGDRLFFTRVHHGPLMLQLAADKPAATVLWRGKSHNADKPDGLHSMMSSPVIKDGHIYGVCSMGDLRCLEADTGKVLWKTFAPVRGEETTWGTAFLVAQGDRFFLFNELGDLIIGRLTPKGYEEIDRAHLLEPTLFSRGRDVVWSHPAFANRCVYVRNDSEIICASLAG